MKIVVRPPLRNWISCQKSETKSAELCIILMCISFKFDCFAKNLVFHITNIRVLRNYLRMTTYKTEKQLAKFNCDITKMIHFSIKKTGFCLTSVVMVRFDLNICRRGYHEFGCNNLKQISTNQSHFTFLFYLMWYRIFINIGKLSKKQLINVRLMKGTWSN